MNTCWSGTCLLICLHYRVFFLTGDALLRQVLHALEEIKVTQKMHGRMLQSILRAGRGAEPPVVRRPTGLELSVTSVDALRSLEDQVAEQAFMDGLVRKVLQIKT